MARTKACQWACTRVRDLKAQMVWCMRVWLLLDIVVVRRHNTLLFFQYCQYYQLFVHLVHHILYILCEGINPRDPVAPVAPVRDPYP